MRTNNDIQKDAILPWIPSMALVPVLAYLPALRHMSAQMIGAMSNRLLPGRAEPVAPLPTRIDGVANAVWEALYAPQPWLAVLAIAAVLAVGIWLGIRRLLSMARERSPIEGNYARFVQHNRRWGIGVGSVLGGFYLWVCFVTVTDKANALLGGLS